MSHIFRRTRLSVSGIKLDSSGAGKRVFVTSGGRGIGAEIVRSLSKKGYDVIFTFYNSLQTAEALLEELKADYPNQHFEAYKIDLADRNEVDRLAEYLSQSDALYGLVHNAGQTYNTLAALVDRDMAETLMQVNFWSMTSLVGAALRPMLRARTGRIIGIGSIAAQRGSRGNSIYAASKGAMLSYLKSLAVEVARKGITVNYIAPGWVDTLLLSELPKSNRDEQEKRIPSGRFADPAEVAGVVEYLFEDKGGYITGSIIPIDGGLGAAVS